jgi:hypothetical protein
VRCEKPRPTPTSTCRAAAKRYSPPNVAVLRSFTSNRSGWSFTSSPTITSSATRDSMPFRPKYPTEKLIVFLPPPPLDGDVPVWRICADAAAGTSSRTSAIVDAKRVGIEATSKRRRLAPP